MKDGAVAKATCKKKTMQKTSKPRLVGREASCSVSKTNLSKRNQAGPSLWTLLKDKVSSESDCDATTEGLSVFQGYRNDEDDDEADNAMQPYVNEHHETTTPGKDDQLCSSPEHTPSLKTNPDPFLKPLEEMFYLPNRQVCQKLYEVNQSAGSLEIILSNVKDLLSRSPPEDFDVHCSVSLSEPANLSESDEVPSSLREEFDHFQVHFNLEENENSLDSDSLDCDVLGTPPESVMLPEENASIGPASTADGPSWEEVFDDDDVDDGANKNTNLPLESKIQPANLDESVDLFGDDDNAFLQISLPNIATPGQDTVIPINTPGADQRKKAMKNVADASNSFTLKRLP